MVELLKEATFVVEVRETRGEALNFLRKNDIDIVLLDLHLPDSSGTSLITEIKMTSPCVKVIVLTGWQEDENKVFQAGADDYLTKPADGNTIGQRLMFQVIFKQSEEEMKEFERLFSELGTVMEYALKDDIENGNTLLWGIQDIANGIPPKK